MWNFSEMVLTVELRSASRKPSRRASLFTTNTAQAGLGLNPGLHGGRQRLYPVPWHEFKYELNFKLCRHMTHTSGRAETECDGTRKRTGGEVKGKEANGGGSQQSCTVSDTVYPALLPLMRTPRLPAAD